MDPPAEQDIEQRIADLLDRGDLEQATTEAIRGYGPQILLYLAAVLRDPDAANDAFSQFAEQFWRSIGGFRRECSVKTWAHKVAWSAARRHLRDPYRRRGRRLETAEISRIAMEVRSSTAAFLKSSFQDRWARLRERLEPEERTLLILRLDRAMSWSEVADVMAEPGEVLDEVTLRNRFQRLKKKLRKLAAEEGLLPPGSR